MGGFGQEHGGFISLHRDAHILDNSLKIQSQKLTAKVGSRNILELMLQYNQIPVKRSACFCGFKLLAFVHSVVTYLVVLYPCGCAWHRDQKTGKYPDFRSMIFMAEVLLLSESRQCSCGKWVIPPLGGGGSAPWIWSYL